MSEPTSVDLVETVRDVSKFEEDKGLIVRLIRKNVEENDVEGLKVNMKRHKQFLTCTMDSATLLCEILADKKERVFSMKFVSMLSGKQA